MDKISCLVATSRHWLSTNRDWVPAVVVLACVAVFWSVGLVGGLAMLRGAHSPMATLMGLYFMLALIALSIAVAVLAASDLVRHFVARRNSHQR